MAPKKDEGIFASFKDEDQYYEDFKQQLYDGFRAQKTDLDKLGFIMELAAMERDLTDISSRLKNVSFPIDREDYESEEEYRRALQKEEERSKRDSFSEEEKKELGFSSHEQAQKLSGIVSAVMGDCYTQYKQNRKESDLEQGVMGVMRGTAAVDAGKHFKELQESDLLKGDPDRDLKLQYIVGNTEGTAHHAISGGIMDMEGDVSLGGCYGGQFGPNLKKSPLGKVEPLKKMTVGQLLDQFHLTDAVYQNTLKNFARDSGRKKDIQNDNAYDVLMDVYKNSSDYADDRRNDPDMTVEQTEKKMIDYVRNNSFRKQQMFSRRMHGMQMHGATRTHEERDVYPAGMDILNAEYSHGLREKFVSGEFNSDQLHQELDTIAQKDRVGRFKKRLRHYDEQLKKAQQPLRLDREEPYAQMFPPVNKAEKSYDNYIRLHSGIHMMNTKQNYKELLAKVLAAEALKNSGQPFDVKKVRHMAKSLQNLPAIQGMKNDEIVAALSTDPRKLKEMQQTVYLKSFDVPPDKARKYVEDMKKLHANMMSAKDRSPEYQAFAAAVEAAAKLKPGSDGFEAASRKANEALLKSIDVYSLGKEKVRFRDDGVARFDNTMDALSIMKDNVPGVGSVIDARVSAVNKTRKAESVDHKDHLDLTKYGAERAQAEYAKRTGQPAQEKEPVKDENEPVLS